MNTLLHIIQGPRQGTQHLLTEGTTFIIGRGRETNLAIPEDRFLSRRHLAVVHQKNRWWVKDLDSSNGSTLENQPLTRATVLKDGQTIRVGQTHIRVEFQPADALAPPPATHPTTPVGGEEAATVLRRNTATLGDLGVPLFALVNVSQYPELATLVAQSTDPTTSATLGGDGGIDALRLLSLTGRADLLQTLIARQQETGGVVLFSSDAPLTNLARHLEDILQVEIDTGEHLRFRYYLPQVLQAFLTGCPAELAERFFGPVTMFLLNSSDARTLTTFSRSARGVKPHTVPIEKLCLS